MALQWHNSEILRFQGHAVILVSKYIFFENRFLNSSAFKLTYKKMAAFGRSVLGLLWKTNPLSILC